MGRHSEGEKQAEAYELKAYCKDYIPPVLDPETIKFKKRLFKDYLVSTNGEQWHIVDKDFYKLIPKKYEILQDLQEIELIPAKFLLF